MKSDNHLIHRITQLVLVVLGLYFVLIFCLPFLLFKVLNIGNMFGVIIGLLFIIIGIFKSSVISYIRFIKSKKIGKIFLILLIITTTVLIIFWGCITFLIISKISTKDNHDNTIIVLGCQVIVDKPIIMLKERIDAGFDCLQRNPTAVAILSGGQGIDENISEAECMYQELIKKGISSERLIKETRSTSTYENIKYSYTIIKERNLSLKVVLITNEFHCYRASYFANKFGMKSNTYSAKTHWYFFPTFYIREIFAITAQCIF